MTTFQKSIEKHFGKVAYDMDSKLEQISPGIYGFLTPHAVAIVRVNHGHGFMVSVTLRRRKPDENLGMRNDKDFGLAHFVCFQNPADWDVDPRDVSDKGLQRLAAKLAQYGRSFLVDPNADWSGLHDYIRRVLETAQGRMATALGKSRRP